MLVHVETPTGSGGAPAITDCNEIVRTTGAEGEVEFWIFFMRGAIGAEGDTLCVAQVQAVLSWPEAWQLVSFEPLGGEWPYGSLDPGTHALDWHGHYGLGNQGGVVPIARVVMHAAGPGRLAVVSVSPATVWLHCASNPTPVITYPSESWAEAGMLCGRVPADCGYAPDRCQAAFAIPELVLSAPPGGVADSTVTFWAPAQLVDWFCSWLQVDTHASWCTAWIDPQYHYPHAYLHVGADAAGLAPGTYETDIELFIPGTSRCLHVEFTVDDSTPAEARSWGRVKALYR